MSKKLLILLFSTLLLGIQKDKPAYQIFDDQGKSSNYEKMFKDCQKADIILFGELHNNPISHWLQYELTNDLYNSVGENLVLGAEMFETDNQIGRAHV